MNSRTKFYERRSFRSFPLVSSSTSGASIFHTSSFVGRYGGEALSSLHADRDAPIDRRLHARRRAQRFALRRRTMRQEPQLSLSFSLSLSLSLSTYLPPLTNVKNGIPWLSQRADDVVANDTGTSRRRGYFDYTSSSERRFFLPLLCLHAEIFRWKFDGVLPDSFSSFLSFFCYTFR